MFSRVLCQLSFLSGASDEREALAALLTHFGSIS